MGNTREAITGAFRINVRSIAPVTGLVTAIPVIVVFAIGLALHNPRSAITMAIGANLVAVVSLVGAPKLPLRIALLDAAALGLSVVVGTMTGSQPWLHTALLIPWCFIAGMAVLFGQTQAVLGSQAIVAYVVLGRFSGSALTAVHLGLLVTLGAVVEIGALLVLRLPPSLRYQRSTVATALDNLAHYATAPAQESAFSVLASIDAAQRVLSPASLFGRTDNRDLRSIVDQTRRARLDFTTLAGLRARLAQIDTRLLDEVADALAHVALGLSELSLAVRHPGDTNHWREHSTRLRQVIDHLETLVSTGQFTSDVKTLMSQIVAHLEALGGQLRAIGQLVERENSDALRGAWRLDVRWGGLDPSRFRDNVALFRDNLRRDSTAFRHAIRLVVAVLLATAVAQLLDLPRGYWVAFSVAVILKPDYSTLLRRGVGRVIGTALGASLAAITVSELHPSYAVTTVMIAIVAIAAYSTWSASFSVAIGLVTSLVLFMLSVNSTNSVGTALDRLIDVALGAAIAIATYLVWPSSPVHDVRDAEASMFAALARYVDDVIKVCFGEAVDPTTVASHSRDAHFRYANAEAAVGRSLGEPSSTRANPEVERGLLVSGLRILRATHALRFEAERGTTSVASTTIDDLRHNLVEALEHLGDSHTTLDPRSTRTAFRAASSDLSRSAAPASLALNLDELVNAINTASHLITA